DEEEGFVLPFVMRQAYRPAEGSAELVAQKGRRTGRIEWIARLELGAAIIFEQVAVVKVRSALRHHRHLRSALSELGRRHAGVDLELADQVDREWRRRRPLVGVGVGRAIHQVSVPVSAIAVERDRSEIVISAGGVVDRTRRKQYQLIEVAPVERQ